MKVPVKDEVCDCDITPWEVMSWGQKVIYILGWIEFVSLAFGVLLMLIAFIVGFIQGLS